MATSVIKRTPQSSQVTITETDHYVAFLDWNQLRAVGDMVIGTMGIYMTSCTAGTSINIGTISKPPKNGNLSVPCCNAFTDSDFLGYFFLETGTGKITFMPVVTKSGGMRACATVGYYCG